MDGEHYLDIIFTGQEKPTSDVSAKLNSRVDLLAMNSERKLNLKV